MTARSGAGSAARDPVVACCADDAYALPLAVAVRSALDHLDPSRVLELHVIDAGFTPASRARLLASWPAERLRVRFVPVTAGRVHHLPSGGHVSAASYARILLPELLPEIERVIYLDSDVVVLGDLGRLWDEPLHDTACLAVQDNSAPFIDAERACPRCVPHILTPRPIENYADLGLDPRGKYFNSGVLVMDLRRWRDAGFPERMLRCIEDNRDHLRFWDQYALNAVLAGSWRELDLRWNVSPYLSNYESWERSPFERDAFERAVSDPWIVHFLGPDKPWQMGSRLRCAEHFHAHRARTAWAGWRGSLAGASARVARERRRARKQWGRMRKRLLRWQRGARGPLRRLRRLRDALAAGWRGPRSG
jgi:lipopolysaccharide biosynthesis glycosyltransferase